MHNAARVDARIACGVVGTGAHRAAEAALARRAWLHRHTCRPRCVVEGARGLIAAVETAEQRQKIETAV